MAASAKVIKLRQLLNEKFPSAHAGVAQQRPHFATGVAGLDAAGVPQGALTEIVGRERSQGSALLIQGLLNAAHTQGYHVALIDAQDSFDPQSTGQTACRRLLWIRCRQTQEALKAADLLFRDGNLALSILDLSLCPERELRKIPKQTWYRLQTLVHHTQGVGLIFTPQPMVGSAALRLELSNRFGLMDLEATPVELLSQLKLPVTRRRQTFGESERVTPRAAHG